MFTAPLNVAAPVALSVDSAYTAPAKLAVLLAVRAPLMPAVLSAYTAPAKLAVLEAVNAPVMPTVLLALNAPATSIVLFASTLAANVAAFTPMSFVPSLMPLIISSKFWLTSEALAVVPDVKVFETAG
jgi:hypothetical protein